MKKLLAYFVAISLVAFACKKDEIEDTNHNDDHSHAITDTEKPVVTINSPNDNAVFNAGDTIKISAVITDNTELHSANITLKNITKDTVVINWNPYVHELKSFNADTFFVNNVKVASNFEISVTGEDHGENSEIKTYKIQLKP